MISNTNSNDVVSSNSLEITGLLFLSFMSFLPGVIFDYNSNTVSFTLDVPLVTNSAYIMIDAISGPFACRPCSLYI